MDGAGSAAPCLDGGRGLPYNGKAGERGGMADAPDLGSGTENVWGFKSPRSHQNDRRDLFLFRWKEERIFYFSSCPAGRKIILTN